MKRLLRSIIQYPDGYPLEILDANCQKLDEALAGGLSFLQPADARIHRFIRDFRNRQLVLPNHLVLIEFFEKQDDIEAVDRLGDIRNAHAFEGANFLYILGELVEEQRRAALVAVLHEAQEIATKGKLIGKGREKVRLEGVDVAVKRLMVEAHEITASHAKVQSTWDATSPAGMAKAKADYDDEAPSLGLLTSLPPLDDEVRGIKRGELWVHAAYAGGLKTTFALNVALRAATVYRSSVLYVSMEMGDKQLLRSLTVMHSSNPRWGGRPPIDVSKVRAKRLSPEERAFLGEVMTDLAENEAHGQLKIHCTSSMKVGEIRVMAEVMQQRDGADVGLIVIDHSLLLEPDKDNSRDNVTERMTKIIRSCKALAQDFDGGRGVPVMLLHQISREGQKREGRYVPRDLAQASEAERSADLLTTTRQTEAWRADNVAEIDNLKHRDGRLVPPFMVDVNSSSRWIGWNPRGSEMVDDIDDDVMSAIRCA